MLASTSLAVGLLNPTNANWMEILSDLVSLEGSNVQWDKKVVLMPFPYPSHGSMWLVLLFNIHFAGLSPLQYCGLKSGMHKFLALPSGEECVMKGRLSTQFVV